MSPQIAVPGRGRKGLLIHIRNHLKRFVPDKATLNMVTVTDSTKDTPAQPNIEHLMDLKDERPWFGPELTAQQRENLRKKRCSHIETLLSYRNVTLISSKGNQEKFIFLTCLSRLVMLSQ